MAKKIKKTENEDEIKKQLAELKAELKQTKKPKSKKAEKTKPKKAEKTKPKKAENPKKLKKEKAAKAKKLKNQVYNYYLKNTNREIGIPNVVTSVLASYRGFDTLGEVVVIFIAGISVIGILREEYKE